MILTGDVTKIENSWSQLETDAGIGIREAAQTIFDSDEVEEILEAENDIREDSDESNGKATSLSHVPTDHLQEELHVRYGVADVLPAVLEARPKGYVHLYDGYVHTIVEVHPMNEQTNINRDEDEDFLRLIDGVIDGEPTRHQLDPDDEDPVCNETADEAEETLAKRGLVNPFHAVDLQRRQNERREQQDDSLFDDLEDEDEDLVTDGGSPKRTDALEKVEHPTDCWRQASQQNFRQAAIKRWRK